MSELRAWAVEWDMDQGRVLYWPEGPRHWQLFPTRRQARAYIEEQMGYIRERPDLQGPPHNWRMPRAVRVSVSRERP